MFDDELWSRFHERTLSADLWTHDAHLRVAWLHLARHPLDEAHLLMRVGIVHLNGSHGLLETKMRGYHETITRVWLIIIDRLRTLHAHDNSLVFVETHRSTLSKDALLRHYTKDRLFSIEARARFVEPDLAPLV